MCQPEKVAISNDARHGSPKARLLVIGQHNFSAIKIKVALTITICLMPAFILGFNNIVMIDTFFSLFENFFTPCKCANNYEFTCVMCMYF